MKKLNICYLCLTNNTEKFNLKEIKDLIMTEKIKSKSLYTLGV